MTTQGISSFRNQCARKSAHIFDAPRTRGVWSAAAACHENDTERSKISFFAVFLCCKYERKQRTKLDSLFPYFSLTHCITSPGWGIAFACMSEKWSTNLFSNGRLADTPWSSNDAGCLMALVFLGVYRSKISAWKCSPNIYDWPGALKYRASKTSPY